MPARALARRSDPATSHGGASAAVCVLGETQQRALTAVRAHPNRTAGELNVAVGLDPDSRRIGRRLNELERAGVVRRGPARTCTVTGHAAHVWLAV